MYTNNQLILILLLNVKITKFTEVLKGLLNLKDWLTLCNLTVSVLNLPGNVDAVHEAHSADTVAAPGGDIVAGDGGTTAVAVVIGVDCQCRPTTDVGGHNWPTPRW